MLKFHLCSRKTSIPLRTIVPVLLDHETGKVERLAAWLAFHFDLTWAVSPLPLHSDSRCVVCWFEMEARAAKKVTKEDLIPLWLPVNSFLDIRSAFMSSTPYAIWNIIMSSLELLLLPSVCDFLCGFFGRRGLIFQKCFCKVSFQSSILNICLWS